MSQTPDAGLPPVEPARVVADLRDLAALTGGPAGSRRLCWTPEWAAARQWLRRKLAELPCAVAIEEDQAGNVWATVAGERPATVVVGSHLDSVPAGGWLDGALGVVTALEILRRYSHRPPPVTLRLVDWADEEGARFGRSLFGSSAVAGTLDKEMVRPLRDKNGVALPDALAEHGVNLDSADQARNRLGGVAAYLELHIEQGPVLEQRGIPVGVVLGTYGVERHAIVFSGRANHAGSTPMAMRHDAFMSAARLAPEVRESATRRGGVATFGQVAVEPGIVTAIPGRCRVALDQRALDPAVLAAMLEDARAASERIAAEEGTSVAWENIWRIEPILFHPTLIYFAKQACRETVGVDFALPSGPLHDAAEMARRVPTVMLFVTSHDGISHNPAEDTPVDHIELGVEAHARLAARTIAWVAEQAR